MRKVAFENKEFYHIYNRGNNKRPIFMNKFDLRRFLQSIREFNSEEPIGSIYENLFKKDQLGSLASKLVNVVAYCLNSNHFHLILEQLIDHGITKFMHRLGTGYVKYFNEKYNFAGSLFQGPYRGIHIDSDEYLLHLSAYVNLNSEAHSRRKYPVNQSFLSVSSWNEYVNKSKVGDCLCHTDIILSRFRDRAEYKKFALESLATIKERKDLQKILELNSLGSQASK